MEAELNTPDTAISFGLISVAAVAAGFEAALGIADSDVLAGDLQA
ncbi:MAG: hypothetical protein RL489_3152 [Pseudomonadota bacterium]